MIRILHVLALLLAFQWAAAAGVTVDGVRPAVIIDVRTAEEFASGHVEGAVNIPHEQIAQGISSLKHLRKGSLIVLYCRSGRRSGIAAETLERLGYTRVINAGSKEDLTARLQPCTAQSC